MVGGVVVGGREVLAVLARDEGRAPGARIVAAVGVFDLDDVGAEVRQHLAGPGTGENPRQFDDPYDGKRQVRLFHRALPSRHACKGARRAFSRFALDNKKPEGRIAPGAGDIMTGSTDLMPAVRAGFSFRQIGVETVGIVAVLLSRRSRQMT